MNLTVATITKTTCEQIVALHHVTNREYESNTTQHNPTQDTTSKTEAVQHLRHVWVISALAVAMAMLLAVAVAIQW